MRKTELNPCPICGGKVLTTVSDNDDRWVTCHSCKMDFAFHTQRSVKNIDGWITRKWNRWTSQVAARLKRIEEEAV